MNYGAVNSLIKLDTSLQVSALIGILCYLVLRSGLTKKDDSIIVLLISSIAGLSSSLLWNINIPAIEIAYIASYTKHSLSILPLLITFIIRTTCLQRYFLDKIFRVTEYGDNLYLLKNIKNKVRSIKIFLKSGEVLIVSGVYDDTFLEIVNKKPYYLDLDKAFFVRVIAFFAKKEDIENVQSTIKLCEDIQHTVTYRYIYPDAIEYVEFQYEKQ